MFRISGGGKGVAGLWGCSLFGELGSKSGALKGALFWDPCMEAIYVYKYKI